MPPLGGGGSQEAALTQFVREGSESTHIGRFTCQAQGALVGVIPVNHLPRLGSVRPLRRRSGAPLVDERRQSKSMPVSLPELRLRRVDCRSPRGLGANSITTSGGSVMKRTRPERRPLTRIQNRAQTLFRSDSVHLTFSIPPGAELFCF